MKLSNSEIGLKGLGRELVNEGFGDVKVKIQGKEVFCVKSILIYEDEKCGDSLELFDGCDIEAFFEIEKYYSGGTMEFTEYNVCKILLFCVFYDDPYLLKKCKKYIKNHLNDSMMMKLFNTLHELNSKYVFDLKEMSEDYLQRNGYKYLKNDELLFQLKIEDLEWILSNKYLIIKNENWLLNQLIKWKNEMKKQNKEEEELKEEFLKLLKKYIHFEKIKINEISNENVNEIKEIIRNNEIYRIDYISINVDEISNDKIGDIIYEYYLEEDITIIDIEDIEQLKSNNIEEIISILLNKDDIKLKEIGLLMIIDSKVDYELKNDIKIEILKKLLNERINDRIIKCICLFVDNLNIIEGLYGKEMLFQILNFHYCLCEERKKLLIDYINEIILSEEEENNLCEIIIDNDISKKLKTKKITSFTYLHSQYLFTIKEEISIKPSFDGENCNFSVYPSLPDGLILEKENGIIHGKVTNEIKNREYEIICNNVKSEKKFKLSLEFIEIKFTELTKCYGISISNNGKTLTCLSEDKWRHCYLNINMENGIYHIKYKLHQNGNNNNYIMLGLSTNNTYSDYSLFCESSTCNYYAFSGKSKDVTSWCHIGEVVNKNPNFKNHGDGSIYEIIVDMNKREFSISHNNSFPVVLVKDLPSPLYPYAELFKSNSIELLSVYKHN